MKGDIRAKSMSEWLRGVWMDRFVASGPAPLVSAVVVSQEPALELVENPPAIATLSAQVRHEMAAALDLEGRVRANCPQHLGLAVFEGRVFLFESLVVFVETSPLEPKVK
jgi:hypothetical protein